MYRAYLVGVTANGLEYRDSIDCLQSLEVAKEQAQKLARNAVRNGDNILDYGWEPVED